MKASYPRSRASASTRAWSKLVVPITTERHVECGSHVGLDHVGRGEVDHRIRSFEPTSS